jgi:serine/threonine protein kinase
VFEFCDRGSLHKALFEEQRRLTVGQKLQICQQMAEGLAYLHSKRIIHRCVCICIWKATAVSYVLHVNLFQSCSPGDGLLMHGLYRDLNTRNILLSNDLTAKIADFGCAVSAWLTNHDRDVYMTVGFGWRIMLPLVCTWSFILQPKLT